MKYNEWYGEGRRYKYKGMKGGSSKMGMKVDSVAWYRW